MTDHWREKDVTPIKLLIKSFVAVVALCFVSCNPLNNSTPEPRDAWLIRWLESPACQAPCWENITPGETSIIDAYTLAQSRSDVTDLLSPIIKKSGEAIIEWNFDSTQSSGSLSSKSNAIVAQIFLTLDDDNNLLLEEVVSVLGQPDVVLMFQNSETVSFTDINLVFVNSGVSLGSSLNARNNLIDIQPTLEIRTIRFFQAGANNATAILGSSNFVQWKDYGEYRYEP